MAGAPVRQGVRPSDGQADRHVDRPAGPQDAPTLDEVYSQGLALWDMAATVAALLAIDPTGLGGVRLTGPANTARTRWFEGLEQLLPEGAPVLTAPAHAPIEVLVGGIALQRSMETGELVAEPGLLARAHGGALIVRLAERLDPQSVATLASVLDAGSIQVERVGTSRLDPAEAALILLDSHESGEPGPSAGLLDRLAFALPLGQVPARCASPFVGAEGAYSRHEIGGARGRLSSISLPDDGLETVVTIAARFGCHSSRTPLFCLRAARALAALRGEFEVGEDTLAEACQLVIAHRGTRLDEPMDDAPEPPPPTAPEAETPDPPDHDNATDLPDQALEDRVIAAIQSAALAEMFGSLAPAIAPDRKASSAGRAGTLRRRQSSGRPDRPVPRSRRPSGRVDLLATLRAAAPFQRLRAKQRQRHRQARSAARPSALAHIRSSDLKVKTFRHRTETAIIFAVDASGSSALNRMAEAKGAIEYLLADCYSRRDHVALVAMRGAAAETLLPPARSLTRVRRALSALPSGGTTPLASGLLTASALAERERQAGRTPFLVILSDGRGNVALDGATDREAAQADLDVAAKRARAAGVTTLFFDTSRRPSDRARTLATDLGATYRHLPYAAAGVVAGAVQSALPA